MATKFITRRLRILHLEDSESDQLFVRESLLAEGLVAEIHNVTTRAEFTEALTKSDYDLIISDYSLPSFNGQLALTIARKLRPETPFLFFSGTIGEEVAIESLKNGAADYVLKQRPSRLPSAVRQALQTAQERHRRKTAEEKNLELAALLDKASDAIILCDRERRIVFWSKGAERIYGWKAEEAAGRNLSKLLLKDENPPKMREALQEVESRGEWVGELNEFTKDDQTVIVQARATLIRDEQGQPKSLLIINTDITEKKALEEQFLRSQRLESLGVLISGIAHDLNNALSPVLMGINLLRSQSTSRESDEILQMIENSARRGADMVSQVLTFARGGDSGKTLIRMNQLVKEMGKIITDVFPKKIKFRLDVGQNLYQVSGIPTQLHQVLMNLCVNARDAMPDGGSLTITLRNVSLDPTQAAQYPEAQPGNYLSVAVADTGTGISAEQISKIFEPFFTTKAPGKGTGLGLSTSRNIIRNHGGFMIVQSEVGRGSEFKFFIPAAPATQKPEASAEPAVMPVGHGECILVVDDEEASLAIMRTTLENYRYRVLTAANGPEAVALLAERRNDIQLVITDMQMPFMDGHDTIIALRKVKASLPIVSVSGLAPEKVDGRDFKVDAFIQKPFTAESLLRTVDRTLANRN